MASHDESVQPAGGSVATSAVAVPRVESPRVAVELSSEQLSQLALQFAAAVAGPTPERPMLGELAGAWLEHIRPLRVAPANEERLLKHLRALFLEDETTLTPAAVERHLLTLRAVLAPSTCNKVLATGRRVVRHAMAEGRWTKPNPFALVSRRKEPQHHYQLLTLPELARVQARLTTPRRWLFRVCLHLGLRTGEALALQKTDVDFSAGIVRIHRSHGRDSTKTGRERTVPLLGAIAGDLVEACQASTSDLVFPSAAGERQRVDVKLTRVLRAAMAAAGVGILGVTYKCRRCAAAIETTDTAVQRLDCLRCGATLWAVPHVKPTRLYDLRHICATLHHEHGADPLCVSLALGHSVAGTTARVYTHPDQHRMRAELSRWSLPA